MEDPVIIGAIDRSKKIFLNILLQTLYLGDIKYTDEMIVQGVGTRPLCILSTRGDPVQAFGLHTTLGHKPNHLIFTIDLSSLYKRKSWIFRLIGGEFEPDVEKINEFVSLYHSVRSPNNLNHVLLILDMDYPVPRELTEGLGSQTIINCDVYGPDNLLTPLTRKEMERLLRTYQYVS